MPALFSLVDIASLPCYTSPNKKLLFEIVEFKYILFVDYKLATNT
jgi:hypothetical protein